MTNDTDRSKIQRPKRERSSISTIRNLQTYYGVAIADCEVEPSSAWIMEAADGIQGTMSPREEHHDVVIVGGGICGLATALALHRKGMKSLVLEKSDKLRSAGAAIGIHANGWRALDQLMVGMELREKAIALSEIRDIWVKSNRELVTSCRDAELRCLKRSDLIESMADKLPSKSIRFGCKVAQVILDPVTSFPVIYTSNGVIIKAKVLIGCDGAYSIIAKSLQLKDTKIFPIPVVRGFTSYQSSHDFGNSFHRLRVKKSVFGIIPINDKLVHWFIGLLCSSEDDSFQDPEYIKDLALDSMREFPEKFIDIVRHCDLDSLSVYRIRYRHPWHLLTDQLSNGTITVAGDAMHVMGPFLGQGGSAGLEDAIVLARCLTQETPKGLEWDAANVHERVDAAFSRYIKERRLRVLRLSTQSYLVGSLVVTSSWIMRLIYIAILLVIFGGNSLSHNRYNCGHL